MPYDLAMMGADDIDALLGDDVDALLGDDVDALLGDALMGAGDEDALLGALQSALLGRRRRRQQMRRGGGRPPATTQNQLATAISNARQAAQTPQLMLRNEPPLINRVPGVPARSRQVLPLGFPTLFCTNTANSGGGQVTASPQKPWRGGKLIVSVSGTNSGNYGVGLVPYIGTNPVLVSPEAIDARAFPANALGNELVIESAMPGILVTMRYDVTPNVGAGDSVIIQATWNGESIG